jgi:hypothetical protein
MRGWPGKEVEEAVMDHFKQSIKITRNFTKPISRDEYYPTGFESGNPPNTTRTVYFQFRQLNLSWLGIKVWKLQVIRTMTPNIHANNYRLSHQVAASIFGVLTVQETFLNMTSYPGRPDSSQTPLRTPRISHFTVFQLDMGQGLSIGFQNVKPTASQLCTSHTEHI